MIVLHRWGVMCPWLVRSVRLDDSNTLPKSACVQDYWIPARQERSYGFRNIDGSILPRT